jgi:hypothetical protein
MFFISSKRSPSAQQILQRPAVARNDVIAVAMSTVDNYLLTRTPYAVNQSAAP